jgi:hypothetical protein
MLSKTTAAITIQLSVITEQLVQITNQLKGVLSFLHLREVIRTINQENKRASHYTGILFTIRNKRAIIGGNLILGRLARQEVKKRLLPLCGSLGFTRHCYYDYPGSGVPEHPRSHICPRLLLHRVRRLNLERKHHAPSVCFSKTDLFCGS